MKTSSFSMKWALLALAVLFAVSCNNSRNRTQEEKLIAAYPAENNFQPDAAVSITFSKAPALLKGLSPNEKNEVFTFRPQVSGKMFQVTGKTITFQPDKPLKYDKSYQIILHLNKLFNHSEKKTFRFEIKTVPLEIDLGFRNMTPFRVKKQTLAKITGFIRASGPLDIEKVIKAFTVKQEDKVLPVKILPVDDRSFQFVADSIERTDKTGKITAVLEGKMLGAKNMLIKTYDIPPANRFTFLQYNLIEKPELHLELTFSDLISPDQNLKGLVYFQDGTPLNLSVKDNIIKIFPKTKLNGAHKLIIKKSIRSINGHLLNRDYVINPYFKMAPPQVRFIGKGNILPGDKKWIIPFEAINLREVDVVVFKIYANNIKQFLQENELGDAGWMLKRVGEYIYHKKIVLTDKSRSADNKWKSYAIDLSKMVKADPGAIYRVGLRFRQNYSLLTCDKEVPSGDFSDSTNYYTSNYYYPKDYKWTERNNPCNVSYFNSDRFKAKNFFATNIGLTIKNSGDHQYKVYTRSLLSANALGRVKLTFYSYQNQKLASITTNGKGEATVSMDKEPFLLIAQHKHQFAYLKLSGGNALSYSKFNTSGVKATKGLKGYIFGERGVWRPGDTLFLTFVLQDKQKIIPAGHPLTFTVFDARNKKVFSETTTQGVNDFYVFRVPTKQDAPTGVWRAVMKLGNDRFTKNLRIETVLPNRLKIKMTAASTRFTPGSKKHLTLLATWLHGGLASGLKANVTESIASKRTVFKGYKDFVFDDPAKHFRPDERTIFNSKLNSKGIVRFKIDVPDKNGLPGMINLTFVTKVFEAGGRFSIDQKSFEYAPFKTFVGIKAPEPGSSGYIETGKNQKFMVATVNAVGEKVSVHNLKVEIYKLDWSWWYNSNNSTLASYISRHYENKIFTKHISTTNGKGSFYFKLKYPQWGRFFVRVTDQKGGHSTGILVYFDWPSSYARGDRSRGDATLLSLSTDKPKYHTGDDAVISFPSPPGARALISLEKNDKVIRSWWVDTKGKQTVVKFKVTEEMTPNIYVFVSVIQPHLQTKNDLPIRSYGVVPVMVEDPATFLKPVISMPDKIKPETKYQIKISEANGRKMTYVLAVVDEGLLDLTHFKTPSLHDYFYQKEALAVNTWDFYNDVIGAYGGRLSQVFAIGGGGTVQELSRKKLNRFKPVVTFLGPFTLQKGSHGQAHILKMSNYIGSVRVMVVAGNAGAYGSSEKTVAVKQPLMVLASMPRTLVPGETLKLPVTIFAMEDNIKRVKLSVSVNGMFTVSRPHQEIDFTHTGEKIAYLKVKVANREGIGKATLKVVSGRETAFYDIEISIRNPNQRVFHTESYSLESGKSVKAKPKFIPGATGTQMSFTVSKIPPINLEKRLQYLISYPYGCIEQTVSSVFPQLYLGKLSSLSGKQQAEIENNIKSTIKKLSGFQTYSGAFTYWPDGRYPNDWGTSYTGNFLILAKEQGYYVPMDMLNSWILYQQKAANDWNGRPDKYGSYRDDLNQAYRLYTLALAGKPVMSAMNRMREMTNLSNQALLRLAAAYALINQKSTARQIMRNAKWSGSGGQDDWRNNYGSEIRNYALAMETYLLTGDRTAAFEIFKEIAKALGGDQWMSTQTTAYALYSVARFVGNEKNELPFTFDYSYGKTKATEKSEKPVFTRKVKPMAGKILAVKNKSEQLLFVNVETSGIPLPGKTINEQQNLNLKVAYNDMNGKTLAVSQLPQGKDFYAKVEIYNPSLRNYNNLALRFIVPSGWEILNTRMLNVGTNLKSSSYDYLDIRDDRVNIFFGLNYKKVKTFYILLNASYPGKYFLSPVSCKAMYDNTVHAVLGGGMVEVGK